MNLSKIIVRLRKSKNISQNKFAQKLGLSSVHYCAIENNRKNVTIELLKKIAEATDTQLIITFIDK